MRILSLILALTLPTIAIAQDIETPQQMLKDGWKNWYACEENADCMLAEAPCGAVTSINKKFKEEHQAEVQSRQGAMDCVFPEVADLKAFRVVCESGYCAVNRQPK